MTNQNDKDGLCILSPKDLDIVSVLKERFGSKDGFYIAKEIEIPSVEAIELIEIVVDKFGVENAVMWLKRYFEVLGDRTPIVGDKFGVKNAVMWLGRYFEGLGDRTPIKAYIQGDKAKVLAYLDEWHVQNGCLSLIDPIENQKMEYKEMRDLIVFNLLCLLFMLSGIGITIFYIVVIDPPCVSNNLPDRVELRSQ